MVLKLSERDEGEILVKTPSLFLGYISPSHSVHRNTDRPSLRYLNSPDSTAKRFDSEGFFKTGDLAIRQNGRYIFKGRANMDSQHHPLFVNSFNAVH